MTYFGKPKQCYKCHIEAVYDSWKVLYYQKENVIKNLCNRYAVSQERFKIASLLTVVFHDAGKPSISFQRAMKKKALNGQEPTSQIFCNKCESSIPFPSQGNKIDYRHEIIGGLALLCLGSKYNESDGKLETNGFPFEFFAAIGHHKPVNPDSFRREWNEFFGDPNELVRIGYGEEQWNHVMEVARIIFEKEGLTLKEIAWKEVNKDGQNVIETIKENIDVTPLVVQEAIDNAGETKVIGQIRETLALLKSLLVSADWEGSSKKKIHSTVSLSEDDFWKKVEDKVKKDTAKPFDKRPFQQKLSDLRGHAIAIAPTGSGKTEGAIAWALNNKTLNGKILYVLPNQVLTNSIYERLKKYFGDENVGLLHSSALLYQILSRVENAETDEPEQYDLKDFSPTEDERTLHTYNRMMFRPIMVTTVDQLLMTAFNGNKRWSVVMGEIMGGSIIFDEIHAYDGHMLALLERITREIRNYSNMLFMSATMPKNLIDFLSKLLCINDNQIVKDSALLQDARNKYSTKYITKSLIENEKLSKDVTDSIKKLIENNKRIIIVCNTVKTAQNVFNQLKNNKNLSNYTKLCLHSRFIAKHRREKEAILEKDNKNSWPQILIATQVIECGMDIDYDVLFTEGAPLESIIQRAGRVNRERNAKNKGIVYIFKQDDASEKFYPPEITKKGLEILMNKAENIEPELTEEELINMIEDIYIDKKFENDVRFLNTRRVLDELIYDIGAVQDLPETDLHTRFVTYKMVEVVPEYFWDKIKNTNQFVIMEHLVKMPLWAFLLTKSKSGDDKWKVMNMDYDDEIGGTFDITNILESKKKYELLFA